MDPVIFFLTLVLLDLAATGHHSCSATEMHSRVSDTHESVCAKRRPNPPAPPSPLHNSPIHSKLPPKGNAPRRFRHRHCVRRFHRRRLLLASTVESASNPDARG
ncbi:hypothetical protein KSP40_PGU019617 [Platanthera guangdongensis]|uniref:Secreted protein n=1 Tax=Platanthera guangdongensis TaxID=2320717 RepID=A0ABR2N1E0_9ASPA